MGRRATRRPTSWAGRWARSSAAWSRDARASTPGDKEMIVTGLVLGAGGKPVSGAPVLVLGASNAPLRAVNRDKVLAEGKTDADGRFRLPAPRTSSAQYRDGYVVATAEKHAP